MVARVQALMAGLWAGLVLALGAMTAPRLFALLPRADAGRVAGDLFGLEARLSLAVGVVMILLERRRHEDDPGGGASAMGPRMLIALAVIFLTVMAEYVRRPMLDAARQNQGAASASFLWLHGVSAALFVLKAALLVALAWQAAGRGAPEAGTR